AQSACFIATSILSEYANGIFGLAEITQLGQSTGENSAEMEIFGFNRDQFLTYFRDPKVGLNGHWYTSFPPVYSKSDIPTNDNSNERSAQYFEEISRIYLRSGFPTIAMVDAGRMAGVSKSNA